MSQAQLNVLEAYTRITDLNGAAQVFRAAVELGVFDALESGQKTAAQLADACQTQAEPTELLLDALCAVGVVERYEDHFALAQVMHLMPAEFRDLGDRYWQHLTEFVRTGKPVPHIEASPLDEADFHIEDAASQWIMTPAALDVNRMLDIGHSRQGLRILDLAAGSAVCSLAMAHCDPQCHLTVVDQPHELAAARSHAEGIGVSDRVDWIEADYRMVELPAESFGLVLLASGTYREGVDEDLCSLLKRIRTWLRPGGELAVIDAFPGQEQGILHFGLYRLSVALRTEQGRIRSPAQLRAVLTEAGFEQLMYAHLPSPPHILGLMLGLKASSETTR